MRGVDHPAPCQPAHLVGEYPVGSIMRTISRVEPTQGPHDLWPDKSAEERSVRKLDKAVRDIEFRIEHIVMMCRKVDIAFVGIHRAWNVMPDDVGSGRQNLPGNSYGSAVMLVENELKLLHPIGHDDCVIVQDEDQIIKVTDLS